MTTLELLEIIPESQVFRSTLVVVAVLLLRVAVKKSLAARWRFLLCLFAAVWLLVPTTPTTGWTVWKEPPVRPETRVSFSVPVEDQWLPPHPITVDEILHEEESSLFSPPIISDALFPKETIEIDLTFWFIGTWLLGVILLLSTWIWRELQLRIAMQRAAPLTNNRLITLLAEAKLEIAVNKTVRLYRLDNCAGPGLIGLWRPAIIVNRSFGRDLTDEQVRHVLLHELAHLKRHDLWSRALVRIATIWQWPNPIAWWLWRASSCEMELATDALVLRSTKEKDNVAYGETILQIAKSLSLLPFHKRHQPFPGMADNAGRSHLAARIRAIADPMNKKTSRWKLFSVGLYILFLGVFVGLTPASAEREAAARIRLMKEYKSKLSSTIIPEVNFDATTLDEVIRVLQRKAEENNLEKGVPIFFSESSNDLASDMRVTLRLKETRLDDILKYVTQITKTSFQVTDRGVQIGSTLSTAEGLYTYKFLVPPTFLSGDVDPYAGQPSVLVRRTAKEVLEKAGITFPPGSTAIYNPGTSTLIVKNSLDQVELIDAYVDSIRGNVEKFILTEVRIYESETTEMVKLIEKIEPIERLRIGLEERQFATRKEMLDYLASEEVKKGKFQPLGVASPEVYLDFNTQIKANPKIETSA